MSKIQTIVCLLILLVVLFSMDIIFGNSLRETFGGGGRGGGGRGLGLGQGLAIRNDILENNYNNNYNQQSDDQPLYFSFPLFNLTHNK